MYLRSSIISTTYVIVIDWIIPTVRKHIVPQETLACACVAVGVEEAAERWIVISALEVVEARLRWVILPFAMIFARQKDCVLFSPLYIISKKGVDLQHLFGLIFSLD